MSDTRRVDLTTSARKIEGTGEFVGRYTLTGYTEVAYIDYKGIVTQEGKDEPARYSTESEAKEMAGLAARQIIDRLID